MATHDRRRFVGEAISSFQAQRLTDSELIIVDDGEDSVLDLVPVSDRFRYVQVPGRNHFCELRDVALRFARGRYVAVLDDDDLSHPERLAVQVDTLEHTGARLCLLGSSIVTQESPPGRWVYTPPNPFVLDNSAVFVATPGFSFHADATCYSALRALRAEFWNDYVAVTGRPELMTTRMHGNNTCQRPVGIGPEWRAI